MVLNEVRSGFFIFIQSSPTSYSLWLSLFHLLSSSFCVCIKLIPFMPLFMLQLMNRLLMQQMGCA